MYSLDVLARKLLHLMFNADFTGLLRIIIFLLTGVFISGIYGCGGGGGDNGSNEDTDDGAEPSDPTLTYTLQGTIQAASGNAVDNDTNDPFALRQTNDSPATAQLIPNPVLVGGYANQAGAGPGGASRIIGDPQDWYRVVLGANQTITLFIAEDGKINDLDLGIFDLNGNLINAGLGQGKFESLTIPQSGEYFILIEVFQGASNYVLTIGQQTETATYGPRLSDAFIPGDVIVNFNENIALNKAEAIKSQARILTMTLKGGGKGRNVLLGFQAMTRAELYRNVGMADASPTAIFKAARSSHSVEHVDTLLALKTLNLRADVDSAALNFIRKPTFVPNDEFYPRQWHYPLINLPQAWDLSTGDGATVAVLDTGVVVSHPDLQGQLLAGYDFVSDPVNAGDGDSIDPDPGDSGSNVPGSGSFHGTHVIGTIAAATNNTIGVAGVAFSARIMPLRVIGLLGATDYDIEQAVRYAAGLPNDSGTLPSRRADVINLSLGGPGFSPTSQAVYDMARQAGVIIVAAAGNASNSTPSFPASLDGVISVSAVDINKELAPYSSFGAFIDVAAPGGNTARDLNGDGNPDGVLSTVASTAEGVINPDYTFLQGTSMATPHVAGVMALMRSANPALTPENIDDILSSGLITEDLGVPGRDNDFGHGLINGYQAVVAAADIASGGEIVPIPILVVSPSALNFGLNLSSLALKVSNGGKGDLNVNSPSEDSSGWLTLEAAVAANGLGDITVRVNRDGLPDGIYTANIAFTSNANTVQVPVIMQVANNLRAGEIGQHYVVLIDSFTKQTVSSVAATRQSNGNYIYAMDGVSAGTYQIFAGNDSNNNGFICDVGEACGAFLTLDNPLDTKVDADRDDLNFVSGFTVNLVDILSSETSDAARGKLSRINNNKKLERH